MPSSSIPCHQSNPIRLDDLIDIDPIQDMVAAHYRASHIPLSIIDASDARVLVAAGWQEICAKFHRQHPDTKQRCIDSDLDFVPPSQGQAIAYVCHNGLQHVGIPIFVDQVHVATIFLGQFLYQRDEETRQFFQKQGQHCGFDLKAYMRAFEQVPVFSWEHVSNVIEYNTALATFIAELAAKNKKLQEQLQRRTQAEQALSRNEQFLSAVFDSIQDGISVLDTDLNIFRVNEVMRQWYAPNLPLEGKKCHLCYHEQASPCFPCPTLRSLHTGRSERDIVPGLPGRTEQWLELYSYPMRDQKTGEISHLIEFIRDITNRVQTERSLRESERKLSTLFQNLPGIVYRCRNDAQWTMEFLSHGCKECTGYEAEAFVHNAQLAFSDIIFPEDREWVWAEVQAAIGQGRPFEIEYRILHASGQERWCWERGVGINDDQGRVTTIEGFISDITNRKQLQAQYLQAQKMEAIGHLAGGVAHDLNNMLQVMCGYMSMVEEALPEDSKEQKYLQHIKTSEQRAEALVNQLLAFSRRQVLRPVDIDFNVIVTDFMGMIKPIIGDHVEVEVSCGDQVGMVRADQVQMEQMLMNLCLNARDAMPDGGTLTLQTHKVDLSESVTHTSVQLPPGPYILLTVTDTGCGMDQATADQIFEPFFTTKQVGEGSGLGLSTVFGIVTQHEGAIEVHSHPDQGSRFQIYLPQSSPRPARSPLRECREVKGGSECILVVDDNGMVLELVTEILQQAGYSVITASNGEEAVGAFMQHVDTVDLVLMDMVMPKCNGRDAHERIKSRNPDVPTLFSSGYNSIAVANGFGLEEHTALIQKPYNRDELLRTIRDLLDEQT